MNNTRMITTSGVGLATMLLGLYAFPTEPDRVLLCAGMLGLFTWFKLQPAHAAPSSGPPHERNPPPDDSGGHAPSLFIDATDTTLLGKFHQCSTQTAARTANKAETLHLEKGPGTDVLPGMVGDLTVHDDGSDGD